MFVSLPANRKLRHCSVCAKSVRSLSPLLSLNPSTLASATCPPLVATFSTTLSFFSVIRLFLPVRAGWKSAVVSASAACACACFAAALARCCCSAFCLITFSIESFFLCAFICSSDGWLYHEKPKSTAAIRMNPIIVFLFIITFFVVYLLLLSSRSRGIADAG